MSALHLPEKGEAKNAERCLCGFWPITNCMVDEVHRVTCLECLRMEITKLDRENLEASSRYEVARASSAARARAELEGVQARVTQLVQYCHARADSAIERGDERGANKNLRIAATLCEVTDEIKRRLAALAAPEATEPRAKEQP